MAANLSASLLGQLNSKRRTTDMADAAQDPARAMTAANQ